MSNRYAREIPAASDDAAFRFFVYDTSAGDGSPDALSGQTGLVEADFEVFAADPGSSLPGTAIAATGYVITERGYGDYDLIFSVATYFTTEGLSSIMIKRIDGDFDNPCARLYYAVVPATLPEVNVTEWDSSAVATPTTAGVPEVDVTHWIGTAAATPTTAGVPEVDATYWRGGLIPAVTVTGVPEVDVTHFAGTIAATPTVAGIPKAETASFTAGALAYASLAADLVAALGIVRRNTAQAGTSTTITLDASASATDDLYNGMTGFIASGTGVGQEFVVTDYVGSTKVATIQSTGTAGAWPVTNPSSDSVFVLLTSSMNINRLLAWSYRSGRTVRGLIRRLGSAIEFATGLVGSTVTFFQPDNATTEFSVTQNPITGARTAVTVTNSETP